LVYNSSAKEEALVPKVTRFLEVEDLKQGG
jgi:hypothetical protein